jgi:hypothetical protein
MAIYTQTDVVLSAGQAAGTTMVRAGRSVVVNQVLILCNPGANAMRLQAAVSGTTGGLNIPAGGHIAFGKDWPDFDNDLYVIGTTGDTLSILEG